MKSKTLVRFHFTPTDWQNLVSLLTPSAGKDEKNLLIGKDPDAGKDWRQEKKGMTENEMVAWHHWVNGHEFEQAPGDGGGHASQVCYSLWGHKQSDMTEQLNNNNKAIYQAGCHKLLLEELNTVPMTTGKGQLKACAWCLLTFVLHTFFHCWF